MASLAPSLPCLPAENLQVHRGRFSAQRTCTKSWKRISFLVVFVPTEGVYGIISLSKKLTHNCFSSLRIINEYQVTWLLTGVYMTAGLASCK